VLFLATLPTIRTSALLTTSNARLHLQHLTVTVADEDKNSQTVVVIRHILQFSSDAERRAISLRQLSFLLPLNVRQGAQISLSNKPKFF